MSSYDMFEDLYSVGGGPEPKLFDKYLDFTSGKVVDGLTQFLSTLRDQHPDLTVTAVSAYNVNLLQFARAGFATADLEKNTEPVLRMRNFIGPSHRGGGPGQLADGIYFARYHYRWNNQDFILYTVGSTQFILKEPIEYETPVANSRITDALLLAIGNWLLQNREEQPAIYVYDHGWRRSVKLWEQVKKAKWDDVILDPKMKKALTEVSGKFFDSKDIYEEYGVPWKRGLIFHGPVGNGKTVSLKALMHTLYNRKPSVVTLYVKSAPSSYDISNVFTVARKMTPCMLVLEDIDTIVTSTTRSYFFNEVDGLENNDGILMVATTNHLDRLDPGLSKRPSRFDRKYLFPMPSKGERALYAEYWRKKLQGKNVEFPEELCEPIADITKDFSFAYLKEAFVATLLELARNHEADSENEDERNDTGRNDPTENEFWHTFKIQVKILRNEMGSGHATTTPDNAEENLDRTPPSTIEYEDMVPLLGQMTLQGQQTSGRVGRAGTTHGTLEMSVCDWSPDREYDPFAPLLHCVRPALERSTFCD